MSKSRYDKNRKTVMIDRRKARSQYDNTCHRPEQSYESEQCHRPEHCYDPEPCHGSEHRYEPEPCHGSEHRHDPEPCHGNTKKWNALDPTECHPFDATVNQGQDDQLRNVQQSIESIVIKDSCDVEVSSTDTQAAVNVQVALQAAIALVISISIADSNKGDTITQDLNAKLQSMQVNKQQIYIENSRGVNVTTTDTDIAVNIQILLQVLVALVVRLGVL